MSDTQPLPASVALAEWLAPSFPEREATVAMNARRIDAVLRPLVEALEETATALAERFNAPNDPCRRIVKRATTALAPFRPADQPKETPKP